MKLWLECFTAQIDGKDEQYLLQGSCLILFLFALTRCPSVSPRSRDKKRDDGKWRDYDRYYDRSDLYREKSSWRRGRSKSRSKSRGISRSRSRSRGRSKDRDGSRSGECPGAASGERPVQGQPHSYLRNSLAGRRCPWEGGANSDSFVCLKLLRCCSSE